MEEKEKRMEGRGGEKEGRREGRGEVRERERERGGEKGREDREVRDMYMYISKLEHVCFGSRLCSDKQVKIKNY